MPPPSPESTEESVQSEPLNFQPAVTMRGRRGQGQGTGQGGLRRLLSRSRSRESVELSSPADATSAMCSAVERFNRVSSDLANERTLLAWIRTSLAAIRTVFSYFAIKGNGTFWTWTLVISELAMATLVLVTAMTGHWRYARMKFIIIQKNPPADFGRVSMRWMYFIMVLVAVCTTCSVYSHHWEH